MIPQHNRTKWSLSITLQGRGYFLTAANATYACGLTSRTQVYVIVPQFAVLLPIITAVHVARRQTSLVYGTGDELIRDHTL